MFPHPLYLHYPYIDPQCNHSCIACCLTCHGIIHFVIPHILITIIRLLWLDNGKKSEHVITQSKNHIPWNTNHISPSRMPRGFSRQSYRSLTGKLQRHSERISCRRPLQWFLNVWDNVPMDLEYVCQQYFICMCFLGFIRCDKAF
jgi:hypothetical protein